MMRSICLSLALSCWAPAVAADPPLPEIVATWSGGSVSRGDYDSWRRTESLEDSPDAIREFIFVQHFAAVARKRGAENETRVKIENEIARRKILSAALREHAFATIKITDDEIGKLHLQYPSAFKRPRKLMLRDIYKRLGEDPRVADSIRSQMESLRQQLLDGADFGEIARRESESQSRFQDGRLGFIDPDKLPPGIADAVRGLAPGKFSELVENDGAVMFFYCEQIKEGETPSTKEVRAKLRSNLIRIRKQEVEDRLGEDLQNSAKVEINPVSTETVLRVGDYRLSAEAFAALMKIKVPTSTPADWDDKARRKLLRKWATGVLEEQRALELGIDKSISTAEALRWQPVMVAARSELVHRIDKELTPPRSEALQRHFVENASRYRVPEQIKLGVIEFGKPSKKDPTAAKQLIARARSAERQIETGEISFADAARRYSIAPSASRGGDAGTLSRWQIGSIGALAGKAIAQHKPGEHTGLLNLESGLWMFEVRGREPARKMTFEEAKAAIKQELRKQQITDLEKRIREEQWQKLAIHITAESSTSQ
jgi:parvulin-like peptidyl-prolyl isomerase